MQKHSLYHIPKAVNGPGIPGGIRRITISQCAYNVLLQGSARWSWPVEMPELPWSRAAAQDMADSEHTQGNVSPKYSTAVVVCCDDCHSWAVEGQCAAETVER